MGKIVKNNTEAWLQRGEEWFHQRDWEAFPFQKEMMKHYLEGRHGILNAPTGSGKTYAMWIPVLLGWMRRHPKVYKTKDKNGLQAIWLTPLRALSKDIVNACQEACVELELPWKVEARTGDTSSSVRARQKRKMPEGLVTTPESLHVLFASKGHQKLFKDLKVIVVDEWHELLGTKRGVQVELAIAYLKSFCPDLKVWGISATIGNLDEALEVLLGKAEHKLPPVIVRSDIKKETLIESVLPLEIEKFPWSGHLGINMVEQVLPIVHNSKTTLIFTNTRAQAEIWYRALLEADPDLAGIIAMHHGSISMEMRSWVEEALHNAQLKVVVCTSSLDLGVDFRPVDTVIQVGGPKGIARFMQRAGRSGHAPGQLSRIYFVPTHSLELIEAAATRFAVHREMLESRIPIVNAYDVLTQFLITLAVSDGFFPEKLLPIVRNSFAYQSITQEVWEWILRFITTGGESLAAYDEYKKVEIEEDGNYLVNDKRIAQLHRLSMGTIVSEMALPVKFLKGGKIGTVEESFASQLKPGDTFWFAGRSLELIRIRNMEVLVKKSKNKKGVVPRWMGSRMQLSSQMSRVIRDKLDAYKQNVKDDIELEKLTPMLDLQQRWSAIPSNDECLIENIKSREGYHLFIYPFEGRIVHEILGALTAWRISQMTPLTFSIAMNDYGYELLSDQEIPIEEALEAGLFSTENLLHDIHESINQTEMANRRFREIAVISGLIFQGYPGKGIAAKHLQATSSLLFKVFKDHDPNNLLLEQATREVLDYQMERDRLIQAMERLSGKNVLLKTPSRFTPFCFPIMVDRLREKLSSEKLVDRITRMQVQLERHSG